MTAVPDMLRCVRATLVAACVVGHAGNAVALPPIQPSPVPWDAPLGESLEGVTFSDGWTNLHALPPPLQIEGGWTDSLMADPKGQRLYLAYERYDFFDFFLDGAQVVTGPPEGLSGNTFKIFQAKLGPHGWSLKASPVNSSDPSIVEASPAVNVSGDLMVYTEFDPLSGRASLYWSRLVDGNWSAGQFLAINSAACNDDNAKVVGELMTSVDIYFESNRLDAAGSGASCAATRGLYHATFSNGGFSAVEAVPGIAVSGSDDTQPFVTADQKHIYWTSVRDGTYGIFTASRRGAGSFADVHIIAAPTLATPFSGKVAFIGEASLVTTSKGKLLYMMCGEALDLHGAHTWNDADFIWLKPCVARMPK